MRRQVVEPEAHLRQQVKSRTLPVAVERNPSIHISDAGAVASEGETQFRRTQFPRLQQKGMRMLTERVRKTRLTLPQSSQRPNVSTLTRAEPPKRQPSREAHAHLGREQARHPHKLVRISERAKSRLHERRLSRFRYKRETL